MEIPKWLKPFFIFAALYDGILGVLFLIVPLQICKTFNITPPNHLGYVQFPALLLIAFAVLFMNIARDPIANKNLLLYGILLKISYCSVVFYHLAFGVIPLIWVVFAFLDFGFLLIFLYVHKKLEHM
ncbi:MAG: hypothetical protein KJ915_02095 [Candidatus Omnitrophica bacterium]|nr:hypothetical protein [Candidatus Omnitrophota bacterium]